MGGAQPLAVTMNDGDRARHRSRSASGSSGGWRRATWTSARRTWTTRWRASNAAAATGIARSIALEANAADVLPELVRRGFVAGRRHRSDVRTRRAERLRARPACRLPKRRIAAAHATRMRTSQRSDRGDGRARARDARAQASGRRRVRLRQQHPRAGGKGRRGRRVRDSRLRAGIHPAAVLRGQGTVPLGGAVRRSRRHRRDR